jgi:hypothetical protein
LNNEVGQLLAEQEVIGTQIEVYEATKEQIEDLGFVNKLANDVLPQSKEQANVVAEIKQFINESGLQLETLSFNNTPGVGTGLSISQTEAVTNLAGVRVLPATAVISPVGATYSDVLNLLERIESNQRKMQVTEVSLTPVPASEEIASFTITLNIYLRAAVVAPQTTETETTP